MTDTPDMKSIEAEIKNTMRPVVRDFKPVQQLELTKNTQAMRGVEDVEALDVLTMESFVDQAMVTRITAVRGKYAPGPRDAYVRRRIVEWLLTISAENGGSLDR